MANINSEAHLGQNTQEPLSRREINSKTNEVLLDYAHQSLVALRPMIRAGRGREVLGMVRNRPGEFMHVIDAVGEHLLANIAREHGLPARLIGEQSTNVTIENQTPLVDMPNDSLDNTSPTIRGLDINPYSVVGAYDHVTGRPIGAVSVDILGNKIYRSTNSKNTVMDVETGEVKELKISTRTDLRDPNITIATFLSEQEYFLSFTELFRPMIEKFDRKGFLYPGGGSFIYAPIGAGAIDAYVIPNEIRSEIDPGLPFLLNGGGKAISVDPETGKKTPYKFDPELTTTGTIPLFIAYAQETIADQIIESYMEGKKRLEERTEALRLYRALEMKPGENYQITDKVREVRRSLGIPPMGN